MVTSGSRFSNSIQARLVGRPRRAVRGGGDQEQRLAVVMHLAGREQRLVAGRGRDVGGAVEILGRQHRHHARGRAHIGQIHRQDQPVRLGTQPEGEVQAARRRGNVVDVARGPGDVFAGAVMGHRASGTHALTSARSTAVPWSSSQ